MLSGETANGAYPFFATMEVGKTAATYFKALEDMEKPELVENSIDKEPSSDEDDTDFKKDETI